MPVVDGLSAIRAIRGEEVTANRPRTPILVLSANTSQQDREASAAAGADGHIAKPIRVEALFAALERVMTAEAA
jgi:CheY-like chemotaxis protein